MKDSDKLKCTDCGANLYLQVAYDGADWLSVKGEHSKYGHTISLNCTECGRVYHVGRLNNEFAFCENIKKYRPYTDRK